MQAMIKMPDGSLAKVSVYRNGETITVVGVARHETPMGPSETIVQSRMSIDAFEWYRSRAVQQIEAARGSLAYTRLLGMAGLSDRDVQEAVAFDVRRAPQLPPHMQSMPPRMLKR